MRFNEMVMNKEVLVLLILYQTYMTSTMSNYLDHNVNCGPHTQAVAVDKLGLYRYIPYNVKLHRCVGKNVDYNPFGKTCIANETKAVIFVVDRSGNLYNLTLYNHTSCVYVCKSDASSCSKGQRWNQATCSCCDRINECAGDYEWNDALCSCFCPNTSKNNCGQKENNKETEVTPASFLNTPIRMKYVWTIAAAEGLLLVTVCVTIFYYFCRGRQLKPCGTCTVLTTGKNKRNSDSVSETSFKETTLFQNGDDNYTNDFCDRERFLSF